jgi:MFS transporter, DHA1 family, multidrug resistance protein
MQKFSERHANFMAVIAFLIVPMSGFAIDIYVPSLPIMAKYFMVPGSIIQITVTVFLIAYGISQFIAGNFLDAYGRRNITLISLSLFSLFSLLIPFSTNIATILLLRFLQGLCVGFFAVAKRAIFLDLFSGHKLHIMLVYMTVAWSIGPIIAPGIGGYLQTYFGWQSCFYFLAAYAFSFAILEFFFVPETIKQRNHLTITKVTKTYALIFSHSKFTFALFGLGFAYAMVILFHLLGSFLIQNQLGYSALKYGQFAVIMGFAWMTGGIINRHLIQIDMLLKIKYAIILTIIVGGCMFGFGLFTLNIYSILIPAFITHIMAGIIFNNYFSFCLAMFPQYAGLAAGITGSGAYIITFMASSILAGILPTTSVLALAGGYLILSMMCLLIYLIIVRLKPQ